MTTFPTPKVTTNPTTWGPPSSPTSTDSRFSSLPYAPFGRSDRLGRCADFTTHAFARTGDASTYPANHRNKKQQVNAEFQYKIDSAEAKEFQLVDTSSKLSGRSGRYLPQNKRRGGGQRLKQLNARRKEGEGYAALSQHGRTRNAGRGGGMHSQGGGRGGGGGGRGGRGQWRDRIDRQASVSVRPDWRRVEEVDLSKLSKGTSPLSSLIDNSQPQQVQDLAWCGFLDQYNDQYDKISTRTATQLKRVETKEFYPVSTTDDPVIEKLAIEGKGTVFATDAILAHLMTCPRSVYPWDIVVQKLPTGALFFDKRDASQFDYLTVHETSNSPPAPVQERDITPENENDLLINTPERLSLEATMINQNYTQQILRSSKYRQNFELPNPFWDPEDNDGMEPASVGYRYRKFDLGEGIHLVARCELHGLAKKKGAGVVSTATTTIGKKKKKEPENVLEVPEGDQYMTAYALNEYDPSYVVNAPPSRPGTTVNWREKLDNQAGAVLASELKNNSFKLAKWTAQSLLAGASQMKLGFVSRINPKNAYDHVILATQTYRPSDLAMQITLNQGTMWGIMRLFIKLLGDQPEGKYVIMRDPNRALVRIYGVPVETFESEEEDEDDDEEEEDEDEE